jgi:glutamate synthase (NADPH) large chain
VVEGCGTNGCEYMTGGTAVILGRIGANFGAGMTGGMAYVWDPQGRAPALMNMDSLVTCPVTVPHWEEQLRTLVERHHHETGSRRAAELLSDWATSVRQFVQVCPKEMLVHLQHPLAQEEMAVPAE